MHTHSTEKKQEYMKDTKNLPTVISVGGTKRISFMNHELGQANIVLK
jgi:hypothetical protein